MKRSHEEMVDLSDAGIPALHSIFKGEILSLRDYGAFVKIPGCRKHGLVHVSQLSTSRVEKVSEVCEIGEKVYCKVTSVEADGSKIALSMKLVNQSSGQDLDPNNVQLMQDEQKKKGGFQRETPRIELGAVYDTTCKKCGGRGHLAQDCFYMPGGKVYQLLGEEDEIVNTTHSTVDTTVSKKHVKTHKSHKSHKKNKNKEKKKDKKHKKKKMNESDRKRHRSPSSASSSSDSDAMESKKKRRHSDTSSKSTDRKHSSRDHR